MSLIADVAPPPTSGSPRPLRHTNAAAIAAVTGKHAELAMQLTCRAHSLRSAARAAEYAHIRDELHDWCRSELVPHVAADERTLYAVAAELESTRLLAAGMLTEHRSLGALVADLSVAADAFDVVAAAASLQALFAAQLRNESALLLPALDAAGVDLRALLGGAHGAWA